MKKVSNPVGNYAVFCGEEKIPLGRMTEFEAIDAEDEFLYGIAAVGGNVPNTQVWEVNEKGEKIRLVHTV